MRRLRLLPAAIEAAASLAAAQVAVRSLGPRRLMRRLGTVDPAAPTAPAAPEVWRRARRAVALMDRVADRLPWRSACLVRAMAGRAILRRRGIASQLHLGVVSTVPLGAHAWLTAGGRVVQGGPIDHVTPLGTIHSLMVRGRGGARPGRTRRR
jgi:hypothetical protein